MFTSEIYLIEIIASVCVLFLRIHFDFPFSYYLAKQYIQIFQARIIVCEVEKKCVFKYGASLVAKFSLNESQNAVQ